MKSSNYVYIIAEAGVNHNGSLEMAIELIDVAVNAGADAVKFQTFKTEKSISKNAPKADYQIKNTKMEETQYEMVQKLELDEFAHQTLVDYCKQRKIDFLSTPFDTESIELLVNKFQVTRLKIASGEITNAPLLLKAAYSGKPIILSTGMSTLGEIEDALGVLAYGYLNSSEKPSIKAFRNAYYTKEGQEALYNKVTLLHCTTEYPAPFEDVNLRVMNTLKTAFGLPVGYSDHTEGIAVPIAAVAMGAVVVEKHFTLDRNLPGPDHKASLEPYELKEMVRSIRQVEQAIGNSRKKPSFVELKNREVARKSIVAAKNIKKGELFTEDNLFFKRPGTGISPMYFWNILGNRAEIDYEKDEVIK